MKKLIITIIALLAACTMVCRAEDAGYEENFESYNYDAIYNSEDMAVSYGDKTANISPSQNYIINGVGGIYQDGQVYTANAAENIYCYAKTGEGTGTLAFGGLNNGWHGIYSHPPNTLDCKGGASGELNQYNRRLAVMPLQGNKVLKMNPAKNDYISTYCIYANDSATFYEHTKWSTDVYIDNIAQGGYCSIYLSKGKMNAARPLEYVGSVENGRELLFDIIKFSENNDIYFLEEKKAIYEFKKWYNVEISLDKTEIGTMCSVIITDKQTGSSLYDSGKIPLDFKIENEKCGMGYTAYTNIKSNATDVYIDNIAIEKIEFYATLASTREVNINAKGNVAIKFNSEYVSDSISTDSVKVYLGEEEIDGVSVSLLSQNRVKISLPKLEPAQEYTIVVNNVLGQNGIYADCKIPFRTVSLVTANNISVSGENISFKLNNNSLDDIEVTMFAIGEDENAMIETAVYKRISISKETAVTETLLGVVSANVKNVHLYVIDGFLGRVNPISDDITLKIN